MVDNQKTAEEIASEEAEGLTSPQFLEDRIGRNAMLALRAAVERTLLYHIQSERDKVRELENNILSMDRVMGHTAEIGRLRSTIKKLAKALQVVKNNGPLLKVQHLFKVDEALSDPEVKKVVES